jgi:poly-gamma-glutamate synthesis protein (capsule biosynthesis protein)
MRARPLTTATALALALALLAACGSDDARPEPTEAATAAGSGTPTSQTATAAQGTSTPAAPRPIVVAAVGDLMLARDIEGLMASEGTLYPFERVSPLFDGAALVIGNLEGALTDRGDAAEKRYTFRTSPPLAEGLVLAGFDAVSLANNHSYDFGSIGLIDTMDTLDDIGIARLGAGTDERGAYAPATFEVDGRTVAILGFNAIGETQAALGDGAGVAWADERALTAVASAAEGADHVLVMVHAGVEYSHEPSAEQVAFAHSLIDAGADVVIGAHPHALQPWERYGDGLILYSLGNFVFDLDSGDLAGLGTTPFESAVAMISLPAEGAPEVEFRPAYIDVEENRPRPATADEAAAIERWLSERERDE